MGQGLAGVAELADARDSKSDALIIEIKLFGTFRS
jgi:hypothetical protein